MLSQNYLEEQKQDMYKKKLFTIKNYLLQSVKSGGAQTSAEPIVVSIFVFNFFFVIIRFHFDVSPPHMFTVHFR
jgi:K+-sensing histidine kinase KdpD